MGIFKKWNMGFTKKCAENGDRASAFKMGNYYYNGDVVEKNMTEAAKWYADASRSGIRKVDAENNGGMKTWNQPYPQAALRLAEFYKDGIGVNLNVFYAIRLFADAISSAAARAWEKDRETIQRDAHRQGRELFEQLAENVNSLNPKAQFHLAYDYFFYYKNFFAESQEKGYNKAMPLLEKSFREGYADSASLIARYYLSVKNDPVKCLEWLKNGAENGGLICQYELAEKYYSGDKTTDIAKNIDAAAVWYMKVCEHRDADFLNISYIRKAMDALGNYYKRKGDWREALDYFKQAVAPPNPLNPFDYAEGDSYYALGEVYEQIGHKDEAQKMFKVAADYFGDMYAMEKLGLNREQIKLQLDSMSRE